MTHRPPSLKVQKHCSCDVLICEAKTSVDSCDLFSVTPIIHSREACIDDFSTDARAIRSAATQFSSASLPLFDESLFGAYVPDSDTSSDSTNEPFMRGCDFDSATINSSNNNNKHYTFMHWNINGLQSKLFDHDFISFVTSFDFVCLVETFVQNVRDDVFQNYTVFCREATKLPGPGRPSGGVVCLIKNHVMPWVRRLHVNKGNFLLFVISKQLFGTVKDILYACVYVPPEGSSYYAFMDEADGISMLENCLVDSALTLGDYHVILSGDLNGRTSNISQAFSFDDDFDLLNSSCPTSVYRQSQDMVLNQYGKLVLNMCTTLNLCIANGMCYGDRNGRYTFISDFGSSVIDYFLLSADLFAFLFESCKLSVLENIDSTHLPVVFSVSFPKENIGVLNTADAGACGDHFVWDSILSEEFNRKIQQYSTYEKLEHAISLIDVDVDDALNVFNDCLKETAACMKKKLWSGKKKRKDWFDHECLLLRRKVRKGLRKYRRTLLDADRHSYCIIRREYKHLLKRKKNIYNEMICDSLVASLNDQKMFWDTVNNSVVKKSYIKNQISLDQWYTHFKTLLERENENVDDEYDVNDYGENDENDSLDSPITKEEVMLALRKIKTKKAAGFDGIIGEFFRYSADVITPFLVRFLNALFDRGIYPDSWSESVILPLYKKGDCNNPGNYRGITLCNTGSKVYSFILNRRLQQWVKENNLTGEHQAGFKQGYSTTDHMFTLLACIQKQFNSNYNRKLYVAFIDFEKAFDSINRFLLWPILIKNRVSGKLFRGIKSMYRCVKARIRCGFKLTDVIRCTAGVKQGDVISPVLFSLFINELAKEIIKNGRHGVNFYRDTLELFILLLADDIALLSETVIGLQTQLNNLHRSSLSLGLRVNLDKSNIIVFRKGGYLSARERWFLGGINMSVVNVYKYLGIFFSTRLSFAFACNDLVSKAKYATICLLRKLREINVSSVKIFFKLFDVQIQPIALYGSEIWGLDKCATNCEKLHLFALKKFLSVEMRTPNDLVYGELCRFPIVINAKVNCIRYWIKLTRMETHRLPKRAYNMLYKLDEKGSHTWATNVRMCLFSFGYGYVWLNQGVQDVKCFLKMFKQRLIDCQWQTWNDHIQTSDRFSSYRLFNVNVPRMNAYLILNIDRHLKFLMTRFRFGISDLVKHRNRYRQCFQNDNLCPLCKTDEDNEIHFLFCCSRLNELRKDLIPLKYFRSPNAFKFSLLMACNHHKTVKDLCVFIYKAFKLRDIAMS